MNSSKNNFFIIFLMLIILSINNSSILKYHSEYTNIKKMGNKSNNIIIFDNYICPISYYIVINITIKGIYQIMIVFIII